MSKALIDEMSATKTVEEELRPQLPAVIDKRSPWVLKAQELMDADPQLYCAVVARMADGESVASLRESTGLENQLIRKIRELHPQAIVAGRKAILNRLEEGVHSASERIANEIGSMDINKLPFALGILVDKQQLLTGGATVRVEKRDIPSVDEVLKMFEALPQVQAEVVNK